MKLITSTLNIYSAALMVILSGCAIHAPMSEMVMFQEKRTNDSSYYSTYSHAVGSYQVDLHPSGRTADYANKPEYDFIRDRALTTNLIFMTEGKNNFAWSLALPYPLGIDGTWLLTDKWYLTNAISFSNGGDRDRRYLLEGNVILQRRIFDGHPLGFSVGTKLGYNRFSIDVTERGSVTRSTIAIPTKVVGFRSLLLLTPKPQPPAGYARPFVYATGSINYDIDVNVLYPVVGIAFGFY